MVEISINTRHDPEDLNGIYRKTGRLQVKNFFPTNVADELFGLISQNQTWFTAYNEGENYFEIPHSGMAKMTPPQRQQFWHKIQKGARDGFQYFFDQYYMTEAIMNGREEGHALHQMHDFVNSDEFLNFMRTLTGVEEIDRSDSFASRYMPGHFLTTHTDTHANENRVAAYTISMTRNWMPDWGGNLIFYGEDGNINGGFTPTFNTLNIFTVPQLHAVSQVAPFAGGPRFSFLGWLKRA